MNYIPLYIAVIIVLSLVLISLTAIMIQAAHNDKDRRSKERDMRTSICEACPDEDTSECKNCQKVIQDKELTDKLQKILDREEQRIGGK